MSANASRLLYVCIGFLIGLGYNVYRAITRSFSVLDLILFLALAGLVYVCFISLRTWYVRRSYVVRASSIEPEGDDPA